MNDVEILKTIYRQVNQAMVEKDIEKLKTLLKEDSYLVHMTGYQQPITEWYEHIETNWMRYYWWQEVDIRDIKISDTVARLTGMSKVNASIWGSSAHTWPLKIEFTFEKINGKWLVSNQKAATF